jgi:hypothetical protein
MMRTVARKTPSTALARRLRLAAMGLAASSTSKCPPLATVQIFVLRCRD